MEWNRFFKICSDILQKIHVHIELIDKTEYSFSFLHNQDYRKRLLTSPNIAERERYLLIMCFYKLSVQEKKEIAACLEMVFQ
jgi:hypothetical protein